MEGSAGTRIARLPLWQAREAIGNVVGASQAANGLPTHCANSFLACLVIAKIVPDQIRLPAEFV